MKYDAFSDRNKVFSEEVLEHFEKYIHIAGYHLRSTIFHIESVRIPSFIGSVALKMNGPQQMVNLSRMLLEFGVFSGVGIKSAMGMGAFELILKSKENRDRKGNYHE